MYVYNINNNSLYRMKSRLKFLPTKRLGGNLNVTSALRVMFSWEHWKLIWGKTTTWLMLLFFNVIFMILYLNVRKSLLDMKWFIVNNSLVKYLYLTMLFVYCINVCLVWDFNMWFQVFINKTEYTLSLAFIMIYFM